MSSATYSDYSLSRREKRRLEEERMRQQEEERRRQERLRREKRRQAEITAEQERLDTIDRFREMASVLAQTTKPVKNKSDEHIGSVSGHRTEKQVEKMEGLTKKIQDQIDEFPSRWRELFGSEMDKILQTVTQVEQKNYDTFYYQRLKWANMELQQIIKTAPEKVEALHRRVEQAVKTIDELVIQLEVVRAQAVLEVHTNAASSLINVLEGLPREKDPHILLTKLDELQQKTKNLYQQFEVAQTRDQERQLVMQNIQEVLLDLGYEIIDPAFIYEENPGNVRENLSFHFRTPERGVVRLVCGLDSAIYSEFMQLKAAGESGANIISETDGPEESLIHQCEQWCRDYDYLVEELSQRDIHIEQRWREPPEGRTYQVLQVSDEYLKDDRNISFPMIDSLQKEHE